MLYLLLVSLPLLFGSDTGGPLFNYGFSTIGSGLSYIGLGIGFAIAVYLRASSRLRYTET
jgi:hypothetical protein